MKKINLLLIPLMAVSFLASCDNGGDTAELTFSSNSENCQLLCDGTVCPVGSSVTIPAETDVTLTFESSEGYLPIFKSNVNINGAQSYRFNLSKKKITVKVAKNENCIITANAETPRKNLEAYAWSEISQLSKMGLANTYFNVKDTKKVIVNGKDHDVRIIGFNQDKDKDGNDIGITFEFANLISDSEGHSIVTQWNDTNDKGTANHSYLDSSVRKALTNEGGGHILWAQHKSGEHWSKEIHESVLDMLPKELTSVLVAPQKTVQCYVRSSWIEKPIINSKGEYDKLFLLSYNEMGGERNPDGTRKGAYDYYQEPSETTVESLRIKKPTLNEAWKNWSLIRSDAGQTYQEAVYSSAGYNESTDASKGGFSWLRSPYMDSSSNAYFNEFGGDLIHGYVFDRAYSLAPAFCI